jgi:hypothetical protein
MEKVRTSGGTIRFGSFEVDLRIGEEGEVRLIVGEGAGHQFDVCPSRMKTNAKHTLQPVHGIMIGAPDSLRAVRMFLDFHQHRHEGGGPVMLRPVKLHFA